MVTTSYEGSDEEEEFNPVPIVNQHNISCNIVSDSKSESDDNEMEENFFDEDINEEVEATPKTTISAEVV